MRTRRIRPNERIPIEFSARERDLVIRHTFAGGELTRPLDAARDTRGRCVIEYTLDDLDELLGYIAAEANHCSSKRLQVELDALYGRIQAEMQRYDDGRWQAPAVSLGLKAAKTADRAALSLLKRTTKA